MSHQLSATCTSRLTNTSGTIAGLRASANTPTLAAARNVRPAPGPAHELYSGSVSRRCCFSGGWVVHRRIILGHQRFDVDAHRRRRQRRGNACCLDRGGTRHARGRPRQQPARPGSLRSGSAGLRVKRGMTAVRGGRLHALTSIPRVSRNCDFAAPSPRSHRFAGPDKRRNPGARRSARRPKRGFSARLRKHVSSSSR